MTFQEQPTPRYDKVVQEYRGVNKRIIEFVKKYPYYDECLTDEQVIYKMRIDYKRSINNKSVHDYFYDIYHELTKGLDEGSKEEREIINQIVDRFDAYRRIRVKIINYTYQMQARYYNCGCRKCLGEYPSPQFKNIRGYWYLCSRCRSHIRLQNKYFKRIKVRGK